MNKYILGLSLGSILLSYYCCKCFFTKDKKDKKDDIDKDEKDNEKDNEIDNEKKDNAIIKNILDEMINKIETDSDKKVKFNDNWTLINN